jgi:hypothetical protein
MKKLGLFCAVAMFFLGAQAMAATVVLSLQDIYDTQDGGGPFTMTLSGNLIVNGTTIATSGTVFTTFCVEIDEYFNPGNTYSAQVNANESAVWGGIGGSSSGDPLSEDAAWLFAMYSQKQFSSNADARDLQRAIWYLEEEFVLTAQEVLDNPYLQAVSTTFNGINRSKDATLGEYGVYVVNLTDSSGGRHQDQLILVPDGGLTVMLLGLGVGGLALISRKFRA